jgi:hypothetical protein
VDQAMNDWEFSDEARDAGRDVPDLDEKALVIEGRVNLGIGDEPSWSRVSEGFCPACGFSFSIHDQRDRFSKAPWGCPTSESEAVRRWGR